MLKVLTTLALAGAVFLTSASDRFNRADGDLITGDWSSPASVGGAGSWTIGGNAAAPEGVLTDNLAYYSGASFTGDQFSQFSMVHTGGAILYIGPACRVTSGGNGYGFYAETNMIYEFTGGTRSDVGTVTATWSPGDVIRMECNSSTIEIFQNGVSRGTQSDGSFSTGAPGMLGYPSPTVKADDWSGGDLGAGPASTFKPMNLPIRGGGYWFVQRTR